VIFLEATILATVCGNYNTIYIIPGSNQDIDGDATKSADEKKELKRRKEVN
jgi:hypothetical protein